MRQHRLFPASGPQGGGVAVPGLAESAKQNRARRRDTGLLSQGLNAAVCRLKLRQRLQGFRVLLHHADQQYGLSVRLSPALLPVLIGGLARVQVVRENGL